LGTAESAEVLGRLEYDWYTHDQPHTAGVYAARAVFPYLLAGNLRYANKAFSVFADRLSSSATSRALGIQHVSSQSNDVRIYPSLPLLNFISLLLLAIQRGNADLYKQLLRQYAQHIQDSGDWDHALAHVGEIYFGIRIPRQSNPLMDMMGMMFGGGGGSQPSPGGGRRPAAKRQVEAQPPAPDLD
jgi:hypothetical protein